MGMGNRRIAQELVAVARELTAADGDKRYNTMYGVGKAKYVVNFHDGVKTHGDGSPFYDIATFSNKKVFNNFVRSLKKEGYKEGRA